jgi:hypothetical protein
MLSFVNRYVVIIERQRWSIGAVYRPPRGDTGMGNNSVAAGDPGPTTGGRLDPLADRDLLTQPLKVLPPLFSLEALQLCRERGTDRRKVRPINNVYQFIRVFDHIIEFLLASF